MNHEEALVKVLEQTFEDLPDKTYDLLTNNCQHFTIKIVERFGKGYEDILFASNYHFTNYGWYTADVDFPDGPWEARVVKN